MNRRHLVSVATLFFVACAAFAADAPLVDVTIPDAWRAAPAVKDGYGWYFANVKTPDAWKDRDWALAIESVDDAREVFVDGKKIGALGTLPPDFRSGIGETARLKITKEQRADSGEHIVSIRVYYRDGRTGFNVAAPVLFAGEEAIRLAGKWKFRAGDDAAIDAKSLSLAPFVKTESAADIERELKKLANDEGPLSPEESLKRLKTPDDLELKLVLSDPVIGQPLSMKWDTRGRLWVVEYLQYPNPAGLTAVSRDKFLRTVFDKVPPAPPNHFRGADKVTIHEDTNGDGVYDQHKTFVDGLSLVSSVALAKDGVWVLNPPYLLFYPDANQDDVPDGDPIVHLEGFGIEDAHSLANSLRWGPDGWLYGAQGSTVSGDIRRPGEKKVTHSLGQLIWRYHPQQKKYEVFAEGGGNTFGVEIDSAGHVFSGHNGGNTRGFHYVQGGYSQKGFGKHGALSNPCTFGYFEAMKHADVQRFTHTFVIYDSGKLPQKYQSRMFSIAPLQGQVIFSGVERDGSTFKTKDEGFAVTSTDSWFRPVDIQEGPDGALYLADFYEQRIDHASHYQGRVHPQSGRIYRLAAKDSLGKPINFAKASSAELLDALKSQQRWVRQTVQEQIAAREEAATTSALKEKLASEKDQLALEALWAIYRTENLSDELLLATLTHANPEVRRWSVRLACDEGQVSEPVAAALASLAYRETNVDVRSQLASSARRLPAVQSLAIASQLVLHSEDLKDPHLPHLIWWAIENHCEKDRAEVVKFFSAKSFWDEPLVRDYLLERVMKRFAQAGTRQDLAACAELLQQSPSPEHAKKLLAGFETALEGRSMSAAPPELIEALAKYGGGSLLLRVRQGDEAAISEALTFVADEKADAAKRMLLIQSLPTKSDEVLATLLKLIKESRSDDVRGTAIVASGAFASPRVANSLVELHESVSEDLRLVVQNVLAGRAAWAKSLMAAIDAGKIPASRISSVVVRRLALSSDKDVAALARKHWGDQAGPNAEALREQIAVYETKIAAAAGNPYPGRKLYDASCGKCHTLFAKGGKIGPDLTPFKRDDLRGMLMNVLNPSLEIREGFETYQVSTDDGRTLSGFIADQDSAVVVLRGVDGKNLVIPRDTIEDMRAAPVSLMPEGILKDFSDDQVRDLFAYLRSSQPLAE